MDCPSWTSTMVMFVQTAVRRSTPKSKTCRRSFGARPLTFTPLTFTPRSKRRPCSPVLCSTVSTIKRCCIASTGFIRRRRWPSPIPAGHRPGPLSASIRDYSNDPIRSRKTCTTGRRRRRRVELFRSRASLAFRACLPAQARELHLTKISRTVASTSDASIHVQPAENPRLGRATRSQWRKIAQHFPIMRDLCAIGDRQQRCRSRSSAAAHWSEWSRAPMARRDVCRTRCVSLRGPRGTDCGRVRFDEGHQRTRLL